MAAGTKVLANQFEVGPLAGSATLSYTSPTSSYRVEAGREAHPTALGSFSVYTTKKHPGSEKLIEGWKWDNRIWLAEDTENLEASLPVNFDPTISGITESYFQSGIGSNQDLELNGIVSVISSGLSTDGIYDVWAPRLNHGYYYDYDQENYLFGDDSEVAFATYSGVLQGVVGVPTAPNVVYLSSTPKVGVPER